jgi:uncharacterized protein (TIGR03435 family)
LIQVRRRPLASRHLPGSANHGERSSRYQSLINTVLSCRNATLAEFASKLQPFDDNLFVYPPERSAQAQDATGIEGRFDFDLSFTAGPLAESSEALPNGALPLAEAINRRLGIQLEKRKRSLPAIVVEHMDLVPTEN